MEREFNAQLYLWHGRLYQLLSHDRERVVFQKRLRHLCICAAEIY
jgi:hypothetical protein